MPPVCFSSDEYQRILKKNAEIHGNMTVLAKLSLMLHDPNANLDEVTRLIMSDAGLAASIIKISNTAFYGTTPRCVSVEESLAKVGFNKALQIVALAVSKQAFLTPLSAYRMTADDFWAYNYFCGVLVDELNKRTGNYDSDAYLVGLMHGIGRVVTNELALFQGFEEPWDGERVLSDWEDEMIGVRSCKASADLLAGWKFPKQTVSWIASQYDPHEVMRCPLLQSLQFAREVARQNRYSIDTVSWVVVPGTDLPGFVDSDTLLDLLDLALISCRSMRDSLASI